MTHPYVGGATLPDCHTSSKHGQAHHTESTENLRWGHDVKCVVQAALSHLPEVFIRESCTPIFAAVIAAPIRKLWPDTTA